MIVTAAYTAGFCKMAAAFGVDPQALVKRAAYGDVVNAGLSSLAMGSPLAPRPYTPGTNRIKPTEQLQRENRNTAVGGVIGLSLPYAPHVLRAGRAALGAIPQSVRTGAFGLSAADVAGQGYAFVNPRKGSPESYVRDADNYTYRLKNRALAVGVPASSLLQDDIADTAFNVGVGGINDRLAEIGRYVDKPRTLDERVPEKYEKSRAALTFLGRIPLVGNVLTAAGDVAAYRERGLPWLSSLARAGIKALPGYRSLTDHP